MNLIRKSCLAFILLSACFLSACSGRSYFDAGNRKGVVSEKSKDSSDTAAASEWIVEVSGAVASPGVYHVKPDSRVCDAIAAAGGCRDDACLDDINQAAFLKDGQKIRIRTSAEALSSSQPQDKKINLNSASADELKTLPGIGDAKASDILSYRSESGPFQSAEDLMNVPGIKEGMYNKIKDKVTVD